MVACKRTYILHTVLAVRKRSYLLQFCLCVKGLRDSREKCLQSESRAAESKKQNKNKRKKQTKSNNNKKHSDLSFLILRTTDQWNGSALFVRKALSSLSKGISIPIFTNKHHARLSKLYRSTIEMADNQASRIPDGGDKVLGLKRMDESLTTLLSLWTLCSSDFACSFTPPPPSTLPS